MFRIRNTDPELRWVGEVLDIILGLFYLVFVGPAALVIGVWALRGLTGL